MARQASSSSRRTLAIAVVAFVVVVLPSSSIMTPPCHAFTTAPRRTAATAIQRIKGLPRVPVPTSSTTTKRADTTSLWSTTPPPGNDETREELTPTTDNLSSSSSSSSLNDTIDPLQQSSPTARLAEQQQEDVEEYPIDVPSPLLLSGSMVVAIAATGSLFNIIEGNGNPVSLALTLGGFPIFIFLLYAAIKKGEAETKEDDERYLNNRNW